MLLISKLRAGGTSCRTPRDGEVFILNLGETENRFHPDWLAEVQETPRHGRERRGTSRARDDGKRKYFSNGLDLDWVGQNSDRFIE